jgi:hypothetical protein
LRSSLRRCFSISDPMTTCREKLCSGAVWGKEEHLG